MPTRHQKQCIDSELDSFFDLSIRRQKKSENYSIITITDDDNSGSSSYNQGPSPERKKYAYLEFLPSDEEEELLPQCIDSELDSFFDLSIRRQKKSENYSIITITDDDDNSGSSSYNQGFRMPSPERKKYACLPEIEFLPSDEEEELLPQSSAEHFICPFCEESIPLPLPDSIKKYLTKISHSTRGKQTTVVEQFEFCRLHIGEMDIIPKGLEKNYPLDIDFTHLRKRVESLIPELISIIRGKVKSSFRDDALDFMKEHGKVSRMPIILIQRFNKFLPGYYGPKGASIISSILVERLLIPELLTLEMTKPQGTMEYLSEVLVPEVGIRLISQDRGGISLEEANRIMYDSAEFGMFVHEEEDC